MRALFFLVLIIFVFLYAFIYFLKKTSYILNSPSLIERFFTYVIKRVKKRNRRILALKKADKFIKPYESIFSNLELANKFCVVKLDVRDKVIKIRNKKFDNNGEKLILTAYRFRVSDKDECFDSVCANFGYKTTFEEIREFISSRADIREKILEKKEPVSENITKEEKNEQKVVVEQVSDRDFSNKIDINNSSESELIGLPGINIVLAKKIIKFREEEHPFYSVEEFLRVMKIKPRFAKQLQDLIITRKINVQKVKKAKRERIIDI